MENPSRGFGKLLDKCCMCRTCWELFHVHLVGMKWAQNWFFLKNSFYLGAGKVSKELLQGWAAEIPSFVKLQILTDTSLQVFFLWMCRAGRNALNTAHNKQPLKGFNKISASLNQNDIKIMSWCRKEMFLFGSRIVVYLFVCIWNNLYPNFPVFFHKYTKY